MSLEKLKEAVKSFENTDSLTLKMKDIVLVLEKFEDYMKDRYLVSEQLLDVLAQKITESEKLKVPRSILTGLPDLHPYKIKYSRNCCRMQKKLWRRLPSMRNVPEGRTGIMSCLPCPKKRFLN